MTFSRLSRPGGSAWHRHLREKAQIRLDGHAKPVKRRTAITSIQGQLLRHSERREVAIYMWQGTLWVADFVDGHGELVDAITWFRFNCGLSTPHARRRMVHESAVPLSAELVAKIERLHHPVQTQSASSEARGSDGVDAKS